MSSMAVPATARAARPAVRMAGDECRSARSETNQWSNASAPDQGKTHFSSGTPVERAASTEHRMTAADWSVSRLAFIALVYGNPIHRLSAVTVAMSDAVRASGDQAFGLVAATSLKCAHTAASLSW